MTAYVIFDVRTIDREALKPYLEKAFETIEAFGGKLIARTSNIDVREGNWAFDRILVIEFPSMETARSWYDSPEYQKILPIRLAATYDQMMIVEGLNGD